MLLWLMGRKLQEEIAKKQLIDGMKNAVGNVGNRPGGKILLKDSKGVLLNGDVMGISGDAAPEDV